MQARRRAPSRRARGAGSRGTTRVPAWGPGDRGRRARARSRRRAGGAAGSPTTGGPRPRSRRPPPAPSPRPPSGRRGRGSGPRAPRRPPRPPCRPARARPPAGRRCASVPSCPRQATRGPPPLVLASAGSPYDSPLTPKRSGAVRRSTASSSVARKASGPTRAVKPDSVHHVAHPLLHVHEQQADARGRVVLGDPMRACGRRWSRGGRRRSRRARRWPPRRGPRPRPVAAPRSRRW